MSDGNPILYLSGTLPTRSETFVYREIFALRSLGVDVRTASVHDPVQGLDEGPLNNLANDTLRIYGRGPLGILRDSLLELIERPFRTISTMVRVLMDACFSADVPASRRPKVIWQGHAALSLARRVRPMRVGHIHAHMAHVPATIAMYAARQLGVQFSFTGHANDLFPNRTLLAEKLSRAAWVNCISDWHRRFYRSLNDRPDCDYPIVRCGVDTQAIIPVTLAERERIELVAVGRLVEKKGFDVLIAAAGDMARSDGPPIRVRIAGDGEEAERLRAQVESLPSGAAVELLGDMPNSEVMALMADADVFVIPCRVASSGDRDGIPVVLMEAMALGRCVVSGDIETIRELVEDGVTGIMVPPGNKDRLVRVLTELASDRDLVDTLGRAGRRRVEQEFDLAVNAQRIFDVLRARRIL